MPLSPENKAELIATACDMTPPALVAAYIDLREQRLELDRQAATMKEKEEVYKRELIDRMTGEGAAGALASTTHVVKLKKSDVPTPKDWPSIRAFIVANDAWDLVHKRLTVDAVRERWAAGVEIPGIEHFPEFSITTSKL